MNEFRYLRQFKFSPSSEFLNIASVVCSFFAISKLCVLGLFNFFIVQIADNTIHSTLKMFDDITLDMVVFFQRCMEMLISIVCLLSNVYFAAKFSRISSFHVGFKRVLITMEIVMSLATLLHPLLHFIPKHLYSISNGRYIAASIFYAFTYLENVFIYFANSKYLLIGLERRISYQHRHDYEQRGPEDANWLLLVNAGIWIVVAAVKCFWVFLLYDNLPIDTRLECSFFLDTYASALLSSLSVAFAVYIFGVYELRRLLVFSKLNYYTSQTLSESIQIKQTSQIVTVLRPIIVAYGVAILVSLFSQVLWTYYHFIQGLPMTNQLVTVHVMNLYLLAAVYNLYSTFLVILRFKQVKKAFIKDVRNLFGLSIVSTRVSLFTSPDCPKEHFQQLEKFWDKS
ncbi:hypothetical protein M3Y95_00289300 [Aphelenchoides besseyi]|nr:hypothetical protein M3Y95_00289300 [Aphelenchoides besseyi]